jgi:probable HAF family extracellular repeat protein
MNSKTWTRIIAMALFAALAATLQLAAQDKQNHHNMHHHYKLIDLGTFGGPNSTLSNPLPGEVQINRRGLVVGLADTPNPDPFAPNCFFDCLVGHAFAWQDDMLTDLGSLAGTNNSSYAFASNDRGQIVGVSENGTIDPLTGFPEVDGVVWQDGQIVDVGTLGGNESFTGNINNRGQVVGGALNATLDSFGGSLAIPLPFPIATQQHAFLWENGAITDLGTLGGSDSQAQYVNARGQIAGQSFTNSIPNPPVTAPACPTSGIPTEHPFLVHDGGMLDLGSLGGTCGYANWLTGQGQVVGTMTLADDTTNHAFLWDQNNYPRLTDLGTLGGNNSEAWSANDDGEVVGRAEIQGSQAHHAFLWKKGAKIRDLGTPDGDECSTAEQINSEHQIVGESIDKCVNATVGHGWLWENGGPMVDLQTLVIPGSNLTVDGVASSNDRGEIAGSGKLSNGDEHVVLLIPCDGNHSGVEGCDYSLVHATAAVEVHAVQRAQTRSGMARRYHIPGAMNGSEK